MKVICKGCGRELELCEENFAKNTQNKSGFNGICKKCKSKYDKKRRVEKKEEISEKKKEHYHKNKDKVKEYGRTYKKENADKIKEVVKMYNSGKANYDTFAHKLFADEVHKDNNGKLQVHCKTCNNIFYPTVCQVNGRTTALEKGWESHFYCSQECKDNCDVYRKCTIIETRSFANDMSLDEYNNTKKQTYKEENADKIKESHKKNKNSFARYPSHKDRLFDDEIREVEDDLLEVRCKHCKKWFKPINRQAESRVRSIEGRQRGESHFYCSDECKDNCEVYGKLPSYLEKIDMINAGHIEVCADLHKDYYNSWSLQIWSKVVRDNANNKCEICGETDDLRAHHVLPKSEYPEQALDPLNGVCLCERCHNDKGHSQNGCKTGQLRKCNIRETEYAS